VAASTLSQDIAALLAGQGGRPSAVHLHPCATGGNNRVFVVTADGRRVVAKFYYVSAADGRDRLTAEWAFLEYATRLGLCVPRPIARDTVARIALYEYLEGDRLTAGAVGPREVAAAAEFFTALNDRRHIGLAAGLPLASEACFSMNEHLVMLDRRLQRLSEVRPQAGIDAEALEFVADARRLWGSLRGRLADEAQALLGAADAPISADRCVSPSDFGFHNVLVQPGRRVCFIDFEYAGWDDPAKMAVDFFCQPAVPVDPGYFEWFLDATIGRYARDVDALKTRARLLWPVYRIKWCCIILNDFLPDAGRRRRFADPGADALTRKRVQLEKARGVLAAVADEVSRAWRM
jgi:Ser/Thr protein kinase RdoA (MazF antagonist)